MTDSSLFRQHQCVINPARIGFLRFLLEGYDGMTTLSTINRHDGTILLRYACCFEEQLFMILDTLRSNEIV
nr:DUF4911 domain-containing protein [Desulfobulbaceae bacterium]